MAFVEDARRFIAWSAAGTSTGAAAVREMCGLLASLIAGHARLAEADLDLLSEDDRPSRRFDERALRTAFAARLPFQYYGVCDPLVIPPGEPTIGDLFDDLLDVLDELQGGLDLCERGFPDEAASLWWYTGRIHWCEHAATALWAGECWLSRFNVSHTG